MFALDDIQKGEELTFDYNFERFGSRKQKCYCGQHNCRGFLGAKPKHWADSKCTCGEKGGERVERGREGERRERREGRDKDRELKIIYSLEILQKWK